MTHDQAVQQVRDYVLDFYLNHEDLVESLLMRGFKGVDNMSPEELAEEGRRVIGAVGDEPSADTQSALATISP